MPKRDRDDIRALAEAVMAIAERCWPQLGTEEAGGIVVEMRKILKRRAPAGDPGETE